ncbi:CDP-diacylglycerol--glycerol-3-phosphate 3-phosphatidyltransferase [Proteinivorax tanatarense]|uniref:CDP-diacylglycerol--glycerol-3-phosphate 3-phosphatidyltransferase n=1 Tax=Proteinivorax tanatarense TaxID=1260629 RepID=A0AAU7VQF4_9FIRM
MNLANKITIARIFLAPLFILIISGVQYGEFAAAFFFILAASTDGLDGYIARKKKQVTTFGKFLDPLADKLLITAALFALVGLGSIGPLVGFVIVSREFAVTGLRVIAAGEGIVISASKWGKLKTVSQIVAISALTIDAGVKAHELFSTTWVVRMPVELIAQLSLVIAILLTVFSGIDYFYKNKEVIIQGGFK